MTKEEFLEHLNKQTYDKKYGDIECVSYSGYSKSHLTWENIKDLVVWKDRSVSELGCFVAGSKVLTKNFEEKNIEDIKVGEFVYTHKGRLRAVNHTFKRDYRGVFYSFKLPYKINFTCTEEHPILGVKKEKVKCNRHKFTCNTNNNLKCSCCGRKLYIPEFIEAKNLVKGDYLCIPKIKIKEIETSNKDLAILLGWYLAEGSLMYSHRPHISGVSMCLNIKENESAEEIKQVALKLGATSVTIKKRPEKNIQEVMVFGKTLATLIYSLGGQHANNKKLSSEVFIWNRKDILELIKRWFLGDGCYYKRFWVGAQYTCTSVSYKLIKQMIFLFNLLGIVPSFSGQFSSKARYFAYKLGLHGTDINLLLNDKVKYFSKKRYRINDDYFFIPINEIIKKESKNTVYNLEINEDSSYIINRIAVHNCFHGYFVFKAKQEGASRVIGFEKYPAIINTANLIKEMNGLDVEFRQWDSDSEDLIPDSLIVLCLNCLHHFPDPDKVLSRLHCTDIIFEINTTQIELVKKYFTIVKEIQSHRPGRIILLCKKEYQNLCLDFTNVCNYRCIFCEASKYEPIVLRLADFKGIDDLIQRAFYLDITGYGEVTAHPDFSEIVKLLTKYNKKFSIVSNGSFLNKHIELLANSSMYLLNISLNTLNPDTYKLLTGGKGDLNLVLNNIRDFYTYSDKIITTGKERFIRQFSFVITAYNFKEMFNFIDFASQYVTDNIRIRVVFRGLSPTLIYSKDLIPEDNEEKRNYLRMVNTYALGKVEFEGFNFDMSRVHRDKIEEKSTLSDEKLRKVVKGCQVLNNSLYIGSNGTVAACCWIKEPLGNIKQNSIEEIRNGVIYKDLARCLKEGNLKYCINCRKEG
ncbi:MAG: radical SAM protein [Patescibacteria group bacterium]